MTTKHGVFFTALLSVSLWLVFSRQASLSIDASNGSSLELAVEKVGEPVTFFLLAPSDEIPESKFRITNTRTGGPPTSISLTSVNCSCIAVKWDDTCLEVGETKDIQPGESIDVLLSADRRKEGRHRLNAGFAVKRPDIVPGKFSLQADVHGLKHLRVVPPILRWVFRSEASVVRPLQIEAITRRGNNNAELKVRCRDNRMCVEAIEHVSSEVISGSNQNLQTWRVLIRIAGEFPLGVTSFQSNLGISVAKSNASEVQATKEQTTDIRVIATRAFGIVAPEYLHFGSVSQGEHTSRRFRLRSASGEKFRILEASSPSDAISVQLFPHKSLPEHWVTAEFQTNRTGIITSVIELTTDDATTRTVTIPVKSHVVASKTVTQTGTADSQLRRGDCTVAGFIPP